MSLYAKLREIAEEARSTGAGKTFMQAGSVQHVRGDGMLMVTVDGKAQLAAPVNDGNVRPGEKVWISGAHGGPPIVHGSRV